MGDREVLRRELQALPAHAKKGTKTNLLPWGCVLSASIQEGGLHNLCCTGLGRVPLCPMPFQTLIVVSSTELSYIHLNILDATGTRRDSVPIELRRIWNWRLLWKEVMYLGNSEYTAHFLPLSSPEKYGSTGKKGLVIGKILQGFVSKAKWCYRKCMVKQTKTTKNNIAQMSNQPK